MNSSILMEIIENWLPEDSNSGNKGYDLIITAVFADIFIPASNYNQKKPSDSKNFNSLKNRDRSFWKGLAFRVLDFLIAYENIPENYSRYLVLTEKSWESKKVLVEIFKSAVRSMLDFTEEELVRLSEKSVEAGLRNEEYNLSIKQMQNFLEKNAASDILKNHIKYMLDNDRIYIKRHSQEKNTEKIRLTVQELYQKAFGGESASVQAVLWSDEDSFGKGINEDVAGFAEDEKKTLYYKIFSAFKKASGGKPGAKYIKETEEIIAKIGEKHFYEYSLRWMKSFLDYEVRKETVTSGGIQWKRISL